MKDLIEIFAQQIRFPGDEFESREDRAEDYPQFGKTKLEQGVGYKRPEYKQVTMQLDPNELTPREPDLEEPHNLEKEEFTFPSPGYFPQADEENIKHIMEGMSWRSPHEMMSVYNNFVKIYSKFYAAYTDSLKLMNSVPQPEEYIQKISGKGLLDVMPEITDFLISSAIHGIGKTFMTARINTAHILRPKKKIDYYDLNRAKEDMRKALNIYENGQKILQYLDKGVRKEIKLLLDNPETIEKLKLLNKFPSHTARVLEGIKSFGYDLDYNMYGGRIEYVVTQLKTIKDAIQKIINPVTSSIRSGKSNVAYELKEEFRLAYNKIYEETLKPLQDQVDGMNPSDISNYDKVVALAAPYVDVKAFERMIANKRFSPETDADAVNAFKYAVIQNIKENLESDYQRLSTSYTDNHLKGYGEQIDKYIDKYKTEKNIQSRIKELSVEMAQHKMKATLLSIFSNLGTEDDYINRVLKNSGVIQGGYAAVRNSLDYGNFTPQTMFKKFKEDKNLSFIPPNVMNKFLQLCLDNGDYVDMSRMLDPEKEQTELIIAAKILESKNKLTPELLFKVMNEHSREIKETYSRLNNAIKGTDKDIIDIMVKGVKNVDNMTKDLDIIQTIASTVHNYSNQVNKSTMMKFMENKNVSFLDSRDIASKFYKTVVKLLANGSFEAFKKNNAETIKRVEEKGLVKKGFLKRVQIVLGLFNTNKEINPSHPDFPKLKEVILQTQSELETVLQFEKFKEHYNKAATVKKDENLFNINYQVTDNLRFRVLKDLDPQYFTVGNETDCCQSPGGAGEKAMIDSFINPQAGVVVLEYKPENEWITIAQSYFHYVPRTNSYILDNVEVAPKAKNLNLNIEAIYAHWAQEMKKKMPSMKYFQAGKRYSDIDADDFHGESLKADPRTFSVDNPYTDWRPRENNINLLKPTKTTAKMPLMAESVYDISEVFYKLAAGIQ